MSREVPEWIGKTDDTPVPPRVRLRVFMRQSGICPKCTRQIRGGEKWECDHVISLVNGGKNRENNLQALCSWCHTTKTKLDVLLKSQTYRKARKHRGIKKKTKFKGWRNFSGEIVWAR